MLSGTDTLWWRWVSFFREHFAAFVFIAILLPASMVLNWRLALPLLVLCITFTAMTIVVMQRASAMQNAVERHYSDLAETAADALGNVALVQSYGRIELEVSGLKSVVNSLLRAQMPVLSWWAIASVLTRAGTTLTMLVILLVGTYLKLIGLAPVGQIVSFMSIAGLLINPARAGGQLLQSPVPQRAETRGFFQCARFCAGGARPAQCGGPGPRARPRRIL